MQKIIGKCVFIFLFVSPFITKAQVDYPLFKNNIIINPADTAKLSFCLDNLNYLNNTEWFANIPLSGTLFGYQLLPEFEYQPSPKFIIKAGLYIQKEFGRKNYISLMPTFMVKYRKKHSSLILGNLEGNTNHGFIEPIYDYKLLINEKLENGFQYQVDTRHYRHDLFINWRKAIHLGDPFKEEFDIGFNSAINVVNKKSIEIGLPFQFIYSHKGGQIDSTNIPLQSLTNLAAGISFTFKTQAGLLNKILAENFYVNYRDVSGQKRQAFTKGNAFLSHVLFQFKNVGIDFRYWNASGFIGPRGMPLFQSVSEKYPGLVEKRRELLIASLIYNKEIFKNLMLDCRFIPYKDFREKISSGTGLEFSYEVSVRYSLKVFLTKIRNSL